MICYSKDAVYNLLWELLSHTYQTVGAQRCSETNYPNLNDCVQNMKWNLEWMLKIVLPIRNFEVTPPYMAYFIEWLHNMVNSFAPMPRP